MGIDIMIDLNTYYRNEIEIPLALRPAPLQITYMGLPSSTWAEYFDYLITDKVTSPPNLLNLYSEKLIWMPHSYYVNSYKHLLMDIIEMPIEQRPTRAENKVPEDKFVFACFSYTYKIDPKIFNVWMNILKRVDNSVLALVNYLTEFKDNMIMEAA